MDNAQARHRAIRGAQTAEGIGASRLPAPSGFDSRTADRRELWFTLFAKLYGNLVNIGGYGNRRISIFLYFVVLRAELNNKQKKHTL